MKTETKIIGITLVLISIASVLACAGIISYYREVSENSNLIKKHNLSNESQILLTVTVINEEPPNASYDKQEGEPKEAYVYEAIPDHELNYVIDFTQIEIINLQKVDDLHYVGEKYINRSDVALCVGYATTNFIDGASCVEINQSLNEIQLEVYYWNCHIALD